MSLATHTTGISSLRSQLAQYEKQKFTGRLDIRLNQRQWCLYLSLGSLVWATGGLHPKRRWRRQLVYCGYKEYARPIIFRETDEYECWDYHGLTLLSERKVLTPQQVMSAIRGTIGEVLFDLMQAIATQSDSDGYTLQPRIGLRPSSTSTGILRRKWTLEIEETLIEAENEWQRWVKAGLAYHSPDYAPYVRDAQQLRLATSALLYQKLSGLVTGRSPLRDLAVVAAQNVMFLGRSLSWYLMHHLIALQPVDDLSTCYVIHQGDRRLLAAQPSRRQEDRQPQRLIYIDDCVDSCRLIQTIFKPQGYQLLVLQDSVQALAVLTEHQPNMVFLNSTMPIVNGYELCTQIRRIEDLQKMPVILLSDGKGLLDRVRANLAGATDFLNKPFTAKDAIALVQKYLT
ncbi:MAG: response regulator [Jaaginema sp. PMC 1079.18]|nr:response regulator [Jaaginema sp. PMC 1080.18]MEC4852563.1 response regulator [Jaaginema sp. PMC 1079.18]MEC4866350.1 response regulator [Jaaginema sp. PMC 1078.18]